MSRRKRKTRQHRPTQDSSLTDMLFNKWVVVGASLVIVGLVGFLIAANQSPSTPTSPSTANVANQGNIPYPEVPRTPLEEAKAKYDEGTALIVDTRSMEEYNRQHIPGAAALPLSELGTQNPDLPRDQEIITYCT